MLSIQGKPVRLCDGVGRRELLRLGALGCLGLSLPRLLAAAESAPATRGLFGRAKQCILVFLHGGPPQHDTWDPKPDAPSGIRGPLDSIATAVPGIRFGELFPKLARQADKLCLLRSVTHHDTVHTSAGYTMLTGAYHARPNQPPTALPGPLPNDHPHLGSILAKVRPTRGGLPPFVAAPEVIKDANVNTYPGQGPGFLGDRFAPFQVTANGDKSHLKLPDILLAENLTPARLDDRTSLVEQLNRQFAARERSGKLAEFDAFQQRAYALLRSPKAQAAFELDREPAAMRAAYGEHLFGQSCLLARRMVEAGVALVSVYWHYEGPEDSPAWDTHANNAKHLKERLAPPTDRALSQLLVDLASRGRLDDTLVVCLGEFGRSPKINKDAGREHWPLVQSIWLAGAGLPRGYVYGASDKNGGEPADRPVTPPDLAATLLHLLGVPAELELHDLEGRPIRAYQGSPVAGLVG